MAVIFPGQWSPDTDLTGNSQFAVASDDTIWVVTNSGTDGVSIFRSTDFGVTFSRVISVPGIGATTIAFDPAVSLKGNSLHFVGGVNVAGVTSLLKYTYHLDTQTLTGPIPVVSDVFLGADYDVQGFTDGTSVVMFSTLSVTTETMQAAELSAQDAMLHTVSLTTTTLFGGQRIGSVTLYSPDGVTLEFYTNRHPKKVLFADFTVEVDFGTRNSSGVYSAPTALSTFQARHVDDRLTVLGFGTTRYLVQCFYTQIGSNLCGNALLATNITGTWEFTQFIGTPQRSFTETMLSINRAGALVFSYFEQNMTVIPRPPAPLRMFNATAPDWLLTPRTDLNGTVYGRYQRGTKDAFSTSMNWGILTQSDTGVNFYTGYNAPPVALIQPTSLTAVRSISYEFDASTSYDPNMDPITYAWSLSDPTGTAQLVATGAFATLVVPNSIGPGQYNIGVVVAVQDFKNGAPLHSATTAVCPVLVPSISPPVIGDLATVSAGRNQQVTLSPTVTLSPGVLYTYAWTQASGTAVNFVSGVATPTLTINTAGANLAGELLQFTLTVSNAVGQSVSKTFGVQVSATTSSTTQPRLLSRAVRSGGISSRNTATQYAASQVSGILSTFTDIKRSVMTNGICAETVPCGSFALVLGATQDGNSILLRHLLLPDAGDLVADAFHCENNYTLILSQDSNQLYRYDPAMLLSSDSPSGQIDVAQYTSMPLSKLTATSSRGGTRILVLSGELGMLVLQVRESTFTVTAFLALTQSTNYLYGANQVQWVRLIDVDAINSGQLLVGTTDSAGNTYETLFSLTNRRITKAWDKSSLRNTKVTTGEEVFHATSTYNGLPVAPVLTLLAVEAGVATFTWSQANIAYVQGFTLQVSLNGSPYSPLKTFNSNLVTSGAVAVTPGQTNTFRLQALSADGNSAWSNTVQY